MKTRSAQKLTAKKIRIQNEVNLNSNVFEYILHFNTGTVKAYFWIAVFRINPIIWTPFPVLENIK